MDDVEGNVVLKYFLSRDGAGFAEYVDFTMGAGYNNKLNNLMYKLFDWTMNTDVDSTRAKELGERIVKDILNEPERIDYWLLRKGHF